MEPGHDAGMLAYSESTRTTYQGISLAGQKTLWRVVQCHHRMVSEADSKLGARCRDGINNNNVDRVTGLTHSLGVDVREHAATGMPAFRIRHRISGTSSYNSIGLLYLSRTWFVVSFLCKGPRGGGVEWSET